VPRMSSRTRPRPIAAGDDGCGCLLVVLFLLWSFGFVTFHSRETGRVLEHRADLQGQLTKAESQLAEVTVLLGGIRSDLDSLGLQRERLQSQVVQLESVRDSLAVSLSAAATAIAPRPSSWWQRLFRVLFSSVPGEITAAIILLGLGYLWRRLRNRDDVGNDNRVE
jgi:hypothetical protein